MQFRKLLICTLWLVCSRSYGQSTLSLSSASAAPGSVVTLNISLNTAYPGSSEGLQWTLNAPSPEIASLTTTAGPAATAAQKSLYCANQTCLLAGLNSNAFSNGVVASVALTLSPTASGNLVVQLSDPLEVLLDGEGGSITSASGIVNVSPGVVSVSVAVTPAAASLGSAQAQQFAASVAGSTNSAVTWTLTPAVGTLASSGQYTAPSVVSSSQTVIVTATSVADPTKAASAAITLVPTISVAVNPSQVSLGPSQTEQFAATVSNASNAGVTWSLIPSIGTLSNGLYTAPGVITAAQTVKVVATSVADPTKSASASVMLNGASSLSLSPPKVSLGPSQTQQFTATVTNASNTAVTWRLSPAIGTISNGLYTAPRSLLGTQPQTVTITVTSIADPTKSATAVVTLAPLELQDGQKPRRPR